jgi:cell division septum initiation protein DivIVA
MKHGVTKEEVAEFLDKVQYDSSFSDLRKREGTNERIMELQQQKE